MSRSDRNFTTREGLVGVLASALVAAPALAAPAAPAAFGVADRATILGVHAEGIQLYECKAGAWTFREPVATLIRGDETVGRHYAGPHWELADGSLVKGKVAMSLPGAGPDDAALLKLDVVENSGAGALKDATLVLRLNTHGGALKGDCAEAGAFRSVPYSADYLFLR
jgi:hypothetical protein